MDRTRGRVRAWADRLWCSGSTEAPAPGPWTGPCQHGQHLGHWVKEPTTEEYAEAGIAAPGEP
jgi:hypothetical protein